MGSRIFGLHVLPDGRATPLRVVVPFALAASAFVLLLIVEPRLEAPLVDLSFFTRRGFVLGVIIGSLSMFSMVTLLLYFNLYAQSRARTWPHVTAGRRIAAAVGRGSACACLVSICRSRKGRATQCDDRWLVLIAIGSATIGLATAQGGMALLAIGFVVIGAGLAVPYALAPRLALSLFAHASGTGFGCHQRLHFSWRQRRDCRWRVKPLP